MPGFRKPPEDRRCQGISARTGERCTSWAMRDGTMCSGHANVLNRGWQNAAEIKRLQKQIEKDRKKSGAVTPEEDAYSEDFADRTDRQVREHLRDREERARVERVNSLIPPPIPEDRPGHVWTRSYQYLGRTSDPVLLAPDGREYVVPHGTHPLGTGPLIQDENGRNFRWVLLPAETVAYREREALAEAHALKREKRISDDRNDQLDRLRASIPQHYSRYIRHRPYWVEEAYLEANPQVAWTLREIERLLGNLPDNEITARVVAWDAAQ